MYLYCCWANYIIHSDSQNVPHIYWNIISEKSISLVSDKFKINLLVLLTYLYLLYTKIWTRYQVEIQVIGIFLTATICICIWSICIIHVGGVKKVTRILLLPIYENEAINRVVIYPLYFGFFFYRIISLDI